ncbi:MAG TPA: NUDIX domain-containing protein [Nitrososphaeraceae archaeon]|nr:NUDIX domain-containing protein [Nitrososphaeraceae archaeon]
MIYESSNNDEQQIAVVGEQDNVLGSAVPERIYNQGLTHRVASIFVVDNQSRLMLQKRAFSKHRHPGLLSESVSAQVAYGENYIDAARRRINQELGPIIDESEAGGLTQICKVHIDAMDEGYRYGFPSSIASSNFWKKKAFVAIYEYILDHDRIDRMSINPYEVSNVYFLPLSKVVQFFESSPGLFVPGFGFTLKAYLDYHRSGMENNRR